MTYQFDVKKYNEYMRILHEYEISHREAVLDKSPDDLIIYIDELDEQDINITDISVNDAEDPTGDEQVLEVVVESENAIAIVPSSEVDLQRYSTSHYKVDNIGDKDKLVIRNGRWSKEVQFNGFSNVFICTERVFPRNRNEENVFNLQPVNSTDRLEQEKLRLMAKKKFPGMELVPFRKFDLAHYKQSDYVCSHKIDGIRYLLFFYEGYMYFLDRKGSWYRSETSTHDMHMVLDGEMIGDVFIVFDVIVHYGQSVAGRPFSYRAGLLRELDSLFQAYYGEKFRFQRYYSMDNAGQIFDSSREGIVMMHKDGKYIFKQAANSFKFKKGVDTLDLLVSRGLGKKYNLMSVKYRGKKKEFVKVCEIDASVATHRVGKIIECMFNMETGSWIFFRDRPDKDTPNCNLVVAEVRAAIDDPVEIADLIK